MAYELLNKVSPKNVVLSGPSGYLGKRVLHELLCIQEQRIQLGLQPGKLVLMSSSPGTLMSRLYDKYGKDKMSHVASTRVDFYTQHNPDTWVDHLGSLGLEGEDSVFVNLAGVAGPGKEGGYDTLMAVNYRAPIAAAKACESLGFGHFIQASTQATNAERAGQVPYSKAKAMTDFALSRLDSMPVSIACLGMLYSRSDGSIGQDSKANPWGGKGMINLKDIALLPVTPIMGDGSAPLQPQEINDAAMRMAYLAFCDPSTRPVGLYGQSQKHIQNSVPIKCSVIHRFYDAVGPESMSMLDMLARFAKYQGNDKFYPVHVGYRNMERIVNLVTLGNLNRQFISLLRSEQDADHPVVGNHTAWESLLGPSCPLTALDDAFPSETIPKRPFPYMIVLKLLMAHPELIRPGLDLNFEIITEVLKKWREV